MEPLNNGHSHYILYREVVLSLEVKMYQYNRKRDLKVCQFFFLLCPLFGVSIIRGSTVYGLNHYNYQTKAGLLYSSALHLELTTAYRSWLFPPPPPLSLSLSLTHSLTLMASSSDP